MKKSEMIRTMAERTGLSVTDAEKALDAFMDITKETLTKEERVFLFGFGTFEVHNCKGRVGYNPVKREPLEINEYKKVSFLPGKPLTDAVRGK